MQDWLGYFTATSVGWLAAAIAQLYTARFADPGSSDALHFYELATAAGSLDLDALRNATEGAAAVVLWRSVYSFAQSLGLGSGPYVGIALNVVCIALTCSLGSKIVQFIFGNDEFRLRQFRFMFLSSGTILLFAAFHLRDAIILLCVVAYMVAWIWAIKHVAVLSLTVIGAVSVAAWIGLPYLRMELAHVPAAMGLAAGSALLLGGRQENVRRWPQMGAGFIIFAASVAYLILASGAIRREADVNLRTYAGSCSHLHELSDWLSLSIFGRCGSNLSLGSLLVVDAPLPIRAVLGSIYVWIFPVPVWIGLTGNQSYMLFKSLQGLFSYFWLPMFFLSIWTLWKSRAKAPELLFLLFCSAGFTLTIAISSLETRHLGAFLAAPYVFSTLADMRERATLHHYFKLLGVVGIITLIGHIVWMILKLSH